MIRVLACDYALEESSYGRRTEEFLLQAYRLDHARTTFASRQSVIISGWVQFFDMLEHISYGVNLYKQ